MWSPNCLPLVSDDFQSPSYFPDTGSSHCLPSVFLGRKFETVTAVGLKKAGFIYLNHVTLRSFIIAIIFWCFVTNDYQRASSGNQTGLENPPFIDSDDFPSYKPSFSLDVFQPRRINHMTSTSQGSTTPFSTRSRTSRTISSWDSGSLARWIALAAWGVQIFTRLTMGWYGLI